MKKITSLLFILCSLYSFAQIKGTVKDTNGKPLPFVNIFEENTYNGTTSNEQGKFELKIRIPGKHNIIFQYLGYQTKTDSRPQPNNNPTIVTGKQIGRAHV